MPFAARAPAIQLGDLVIIYVNPEEIKAVVVAKDQQFQNRHGTFFHNDMIGLPWGSRLATRKGFNFVYLLEPTPELWTLALPHRTQILYNPDISLISSFLELQPGIKMLEAGTGSGSFSHSIARTVAPSGRLYSFEFHEGRAQTASEEFKRHDLDHIVKIEHRDVCKDGFGLVGEVTAVFLDLPSPWEALEAAKAAMDPERVGRICCFSPSIEQVQRTCEMLKKLKFYDIRMVECLVRPHDMIRADVDDLPLAAPDKSTAGFSGFSNNNSRPVKRPPPADSDADAWSDKFVVATRPSDVVRGHTSFLTFAILLPAAARGEVEAAAAEAAAEAALSIDKLEQTDSKEAADMQVDSQE